jgi:hypothetical protein
MVRADWAIVTGWQKLLLGVALCLPIPALSVSGLALPLPSAVYRVAAAIVESTENLAGAFAGTDEATPVLSVRKTTAPIRHEAGTPPRPGPRALAHTAPARVSVRVQRAAPTRTRSPGSVPSRRSRAPQPAVAPVRTPSVPASEPRTEASAPTAASTAPPAFEASRVTKKQSASEQRPADTLPIQPPAGTLHVSPPPAPAPEPGRLDPVTKAVEPVTKVLEPVTNIVQPVTTPLEPVTGRLVILNP